MLSFILRPFHTVREAAASIEGNSRIAFLELFFTIPQAMYIGYMTLYMLELGVTLTQVGIITSLGLGVQIFFVLISPFITDKLGRRHTTMIFDFVCWCVALIIWAAAQNVYFFVVAAVVHATMRIPAVSWQCLMLEDSHPSVRVNIFNFVHLCSIIGGFFAPVGALLVNKLELVPAMRIMLAFCFICKLTHNTVRYFTTTETEIGRQKMLEMKGVGLWASMRIYLPVLKRIVTNRGLIIAISLRSLDFAQLTIRQTFLAVLVINRLGFPNESMAVFQTVNAIVMLLVLLFISPLLARFTRRWPISLGILFHLAATVVLLLSPSTQNYPLLILSAILIALGTGIASPRINALAANMVLNEDRSVANAIMGGLNLLLTLPFGYLGGILSGLDARLPFLMTLIIFLVCLLMLHIAELSENRKQALNA